MSSEEIVPQDVAARASSEHQRFEKQEFVSGEDGRERNMIGRQVPWLKALAADG